jgi:hypothetical protein
VVEERLFRHLSLAVFSVALRRDNSSVTAPDVVNDDNSAR